MSAGFTPASSSAPQIAVYAISLSGFSVNFPVACAPTPIMTTSRMTDFPRFAGRHIFVSEEVLVLRRIGERLDHDTHLHAVFQHTSLDRAFGANQGKDARSLIEIDKRLEKRCDEALRC